MAKRPERKSAVYHGRRYSVPPAYAHKSKTLGHTVLNEKGRSWVKCNRRPRRSK